MADPFASAVGHPGDDSAPPAASCAEGEVLDGEVSLEFELATQLLGTEVRLFSEAALEVEILELTIEAIP